MRRPSQHITARRTRESLRAGRDAYRFAPLNVLLTIVFEVEPQREFDPQRYVSCFVGRFRSWLAYRREKGACSSPPVWHLVFERGASLHAHLSMHVPSQLMDDFRRTYPKWQDRDLAGTRIVVTPITNTNGLLRYLHKGVDPHQAHRFDIRPSPQGAIWGPRVRASRSLGPSARERRRIAALSS